MGSRSVVLDESLQVLEHNQLWEIEKTMRVRSAKLTPLELEMLEVMSSNNGGGKPQLQHMGTLHNIVLQFVISGIYL